MVNQNVSPPHSKGNSGLRWLIAAAVLAGLVLLVVFVGWLPRHRRQEEIDRRAKAEADALPKVEVMKVQRTPSATELLIPGTTLADTEAFVYARAGGYVSKRLVDIGDRVHKGQLLAVIEAPDLDQQVAQARSALAQTQANQAQLVAQLNLEKINWDRYKVLVAKGVFSQQQGDQQEANYRVAESNVHSGENNIRASQANLERLIVLQSYERVTAPFDGVITARNVDVGALITGQGGGLGTSSTDSGGTQSASQGINSGSSGNSPNLSTPPNTGSQGGEMFRIAKLDRLRVLVSVPEAYASSVRQGQAVQLSFQDMVDAPVHALVSRGAQSIDPNTKTLLFEIMVNNAAGKLMPGMTVMVNFSGAQNARPLVIPGDAIVVRGGKQEVATVRDRIVHFRPVVIGRDYGEETEISSGLQEGDVVALNVSDEVREGAKVDLQFRKQPATETNGQSDRKPVGANQYGQQGLDNQPGQATQGGGKGQGKSGNKGGSGNTK